MKQIRLVTAVAFLLASSASATIFQPTSDRQLTDRSEAVVVATVREAASRVRADGYVVTDYRLDVEQTLKGTATGTITVSEIGGGAGGRFTFIADSATYTPGERVMVFLRKRTDGTYFTTSMAMGKFSFTRDARGEAVVTREVSELVGDPARMADGFAKFVSGKTEQTYTTKLVPIADGLHPRPLDSPPGSAYCLNFGSPLRWPGGESSTIHFYVVGTMPNVPNAASNIGDGFAAWTADPGAGIVLSGGDAPPAGTSSTPSFDFLNVIYLNQTPPGNGLCDNSVFCTVISGNTDTTHTYHGETFISIEDADIVMGGSAAPSQFETLITHELGHTIGFRHSDAGTPSSSSAIMTSSVNPGFGSNLQQWDRDAVDTVYGNGPLCQPPSSVSISGGGSVPAGGTATLMANVTGGNGTFTYAWFEGFPSDTSHPVGSNSPTFTTPPIPEGEKSYWVRVNNDCGSVTAVTSVVVQETTCTPPAISTQPASQTINSGSSATLNVIALGSSPLNYQWYQATSNADTSHPVGPNNPLFTTPGLTQATGFWVLITNSCGNVSSNVATISIAGACNKPAFAIQPSSSIPVTGSQTFLIAFATGATSYQWYKGNAGDTSTPLAGSGPSNDRWINQIFIDLLGRPADPGSLAVLGAFLTGGTPRSTVATTVLASAEYRQRLLTTFFATFLHRAPSAAEVSFWLPAFAASLTDEQIETQITASPEYFAIAGGTNAGWINRIYNDVLGRSPSAAESSAFAALLGSSSRTTVGLAILNSNEAITRRVQQYYPRFLRRTATPSETSAFVSAITGGSTDEQVIALIAGADEYFNFGTVLITDPITVTTSFWVRATNSCGLTDSTTAVLTIPQCETSIVTQPQDAVITFGGTTRLSVLASGPGTLTYQWYRAQSGDPSNPVPGGTGPVLVLTGAATGVTQYWVKVSSPCSSANSNTVNVTVNCGPRVLTISVPPTAPSASAYTVTWNGDSQLDVRFEVQEATKADFSDALTVSVSGTPSHTFTHTVTTDTRYYYRVHAAPLCGGDFGIYSTSQSMLVTAPQPANLPNYNLAHAPCIQNCTITQQIFIPGIVTAGKTGTLTTGDTFSAASDKPFMTVSPASGPLPAEGANVTVSIDTSQLDIGSTQGSVTLNRLPAAAKVGTFGDPPAPITVPVSVSVVAPVSPTPKSPNAPLNTLLIPAIAHADGIGTRFVSDVRLTNTSAGPINYQLTFTPSNTDGTQSGKQANITVSAGDTKALNDIVKDWYGSGTQGEPGLGSLEIRPLSTAGKDTVSVSFASVAASRTYSVTALGTFGQFIPALPLANFLGKSDLSKISLQQVSQSSAAGGFRTNLGFVEGSGQPVNFVATLFDDAGAKIAERAYSLQPYESQQIKLDNFFNATGITLPNLADGRVEVKVTSDTGRVTAYASVLDNTTTDPLLVFPVDPSKILSSRFVVPGVAEFDSSFSNFHTDMRIYNGGSAAVDVTLAFTGASVPNQVKTVGAGQTLAIDNVLPTLWNITGGGSVVATTAADSQLVVTARTFSRDKVNGGTFGQFIPGVTAADAVGNGDRTLQIVQLEESPAFRTNLGLVEVTGNSATVELQAFTPDSKIAAKATIPLAGGQYLQQGQIFKSLGFSNVYNGRISARVVGGAGRVAAYGSVIDNRTTDPTYVPSQ